MEAWITYFIKANVVLGVLWLVYKMFFSRDTFFAIRRYILLLLVGISIILPAVTLPTWINRSEPIQSVARYVVSAIATGSKEVPNHLSDNSNFLQYYETLQPEKRISTAKQQSIFVFFYLSIVAVLLIRIFIQLGSVIYLVYTGKREECLSRRIISLGSQVAPFSFFGWIFVHPEDYSEDSLKEIVIHEKTHAVQMHSFDILISELLCAVCWMNPASWLLKLEIKENLEYLADNSVVRAGYNVKAYQYNLLRVSYQPTAVQITNNFNGSQLKKRIVMMNKKRTSCVGLVKYIFIAPIVMLLLVSVNLETIARQNANPVPDMKISEITFLSEPSDVNIALSKDSVSGSIDEDAEYPGGIAQFCKDVGVNLTYPDKTKEGTVFLKFLITKEGKIDDITIDQGVDPALDKAAVDAVKSVNKKWTPAQKDGKPVSCYLRLPIKFQVKDGQPKEE